MTYSFISRVQQDAMPTRYRGQTMVWLADASVMKRSRRLSSCVPLDCMGSRMVGQLKSVEDSSEFGTGDMSEAGEGIT